MIEKDTVKKIDFLKIFTIISYCLIIIPGEHTAIPFAIFPLVGLFTNFLGLISSIIILIIYLSYFLSPIIMNKRYDKYIYPINAIVLLIPLIHLIINSERKNYLFSFTMFLIPVLIFIGAQSLLIFKILNNKKS
jgi:hypothetical protein